MNFSPKKLRISTTELLSDVTVDGEMGIYSAHFVFESLGDTTDHVGNVGAHSPDSSNLLLLSKTFVDLQFIFLDHLHVQSQMFETADKFATGSNTCYSPGIYFKGDSFGHLDGLRNQNLLHLSAFRIHAAPRTVATVKNLMLPMSSAFILLL